MAGTYGDLNIRIRNLLRQQGIEACEPEARFIVSAAASKTSAQLLRDSRLYAPDTVESAAMDMARRRIEGEPVGYITGRWEFMGLPMKVDRSVLIPRVDTEVLAAEAIGWMHGRKMDARVLDLGSGSGCIGCAIADAMPQSRVVLLDNSPEALELSRENVRLNRLEGRVSFMRDDVMKAPPMMIGSFDLVVSNPPYIPTMEILTLDSSVRDYEPVWALDGGEDGLSFYRAILRGWRSAIRQGGALMLEVGEGQAEPVMDLMRISGLLDVRSVRDTRGVERVVVGRV